MRQPETPALYEGAAGTNPHTATAGCSHLCHAIPQALQRSTGTNQPAL